MLADETFTRADLRFMLIGDKMTEGATLYIDIWDNIAPLSAGVYWLMDALFGRSQVAYQILSLILVTVQAGLFNKLLLSNKAYNENSYVPALIYAICMSLFFDFFTLTPLLMSITFLLLALDNLFDHIEVRAKRDEKIFSIGLYIGIASLFYLPVFVLGIATLLILVLFTGTVLRRYALLTFGIFLPFLVTLAYYFLIEGVQGLYYNFLNPWLAIEGKSLMSLYSLLWILGFPAIFTLLGIGKALQGIRFNNYQVRLSQSMFLWLLFSIALIFFGARITPAKFVIIVPVMAFYISHYFLSFRRNIMSEIIFSVFTVWILLVSLGTFFDFFFTTRFIAYEKLLVQETPYDDVVDGKSILVLGDNIDVYKNSSLATPYLNWQLSRPLFESPEYFDNIAMLFNSFKNDSPDIIIDPNGAIKKIQPQIPWLRDNYVQKREDIYVLSN